MTRKGDWDTQYEAYYYPEAAVSPGPWGSCKGQSNPRDPSSSSPCLDSLLTLQGLYKRSPQGLRAGHDAGCESGCASPSRPASPGRRAPGRPAPGGRGCPVCSPRGLSLQAGQGGRPSAPGPSFRPSASRGLTSRVRPHTPLQSQT